MAFEDTHGSPLVLSFQTFAVLVGLSLAKPLFGPRPNLSLAQGMRGEDLDDVLTFFPTGGSAPSTRAQHVGHDDPGAPLLEQSFFAGKMRAPIQHALLCAKMREAKARKNLHTRSFKSSPDSSGHQALSSVFSTFVL